MAKALMAGTGMVAVEAAHHFQELAVRMVEGREAGAAPPQSVALGVERPVGIDPGMHEQQAVIVGVGGAAQLRHQLVMARPRLHLGAQAVGPARDG